MLEGLDTFIAFGAVMLGASMFVTIFVQTVSTICNLRGWFLRDGLSALFQTLSPELKARSKQLADAILMHDLIADGVVKKRHAPAIRLAELLTLINDETFRTTIVEVIPAAEREKVSRALAQSTTRIEVWFDKSMDRVSNRFGGWARVITVVGAIAIAVGVQLDAFELLHTVSENAELRARLVSAAGSLTEQAKEVSSIGAAPKSSYQEALRDTGTELGLKLPNPPAAGSDEDARKWLLSVLPPDVDSAKALASFDAHHRDRVLSSFTALGQQTSALSAELRKTELRILPDPYDFHLGFDRRLLGILVSAGLISLGAPFWFNALKTAAGLRPVLARNADKPRGAPANEPAPPS